MKIKHEADRERLQQIATDSGVFFDDGDHLGTIRRLSGWLTYLPHDEQVFIRDLVPDMSRWVKWERGQ